MFYVIEQPFNHSCPDLNIGDSTETGYLLHRQATFTKKYKISINQHSIQISTGIPYDQELTTN